MTTKVGVRVYQVTICRERSRRQLAFDAEGLVVPPSDFLAAFVASNTASREATADEAERDRRWHFAPHQSNAFGDSKGVVCYGISGFESDLIDSKTNKREFRRQTTHVEVIPLFYEFWFPSGVNHGFAVFQSFAARSCVELVSAKMRADFAAANPGFVLRFKKLLPTGAGGIYDGAVVKGLRLIRRNASSDIADRYLNSAVGQSVDFQIVISARRKGILGRLGDLTSSLKAANGGVIQHDGVIFEEAVAEIDFGGQRRRIGVLGSNSEAGVIDLTDIRRASDGHPLFELISKESTSLLTDFQAAIGNSTTS